MLPPPAVYANGGGGGGGKRDVCTCSTRRCALASLLSALEIWRVDTVKERCERRERRSKIWNENLEENLGKISAKSCRILANYDKCDCQSNLNPRQEFVGVQERAKTLRVATKQQTRKRRRFSWHTSTRRPSITIERSLSARTVASLCS